MIYLMINTLIVTIALLFRSKSWQHCLALFKSCQLQLTFERAFQMNFYSLHIKLTMKLT